MICLPTLTGSSLFESTKKLRLLELQDFALEHLPNYDSLIYGDLCGMSKEASIVHTATFGYKGKNSRTFCWPQYWLPDSINPEEYARYYQIL
jgi:hypothetical protein